MREELLAARVSDYKRLVHMRAQLDRETNRLHKLLGNLTREEFRAYAVETTEYDTRMNAKP